MDPEDPKEIVDPEETKETEEIVDPEDPKEKVIESLEESSSGFSFKYTRGENSESGDLEIRFESKEKRLTKATYKGNNVLWEDGVIRIREVSKGISEGDCFFDCVFNNGTSCQETFKAVLK